MADSIGIRVELEGEKEFRQALKSIEAGLKVNKSEMALVTAEYGKNASGTEALSAKARVLQATIASQTDKVQTLEAALKKSAQTHGEAGERTMKLQQDYNHAKAALIEMNRELEANADATQKAGQDYSHAETALVQMDKELETSSTAAKKAGQESRSLADAINGLASAAGIQIPPALQGMVNKLDKVSASSAALVGVIGGITVAMGKMTIDTAKTADNLLTLSVTTGLSTDALQEFEYASELLDVSSKTMQDSLSKMIRSMDTARRGSLESADAYEKLGISLTDSTGALQDANQTFYQVIDALGKIKNETERDAISMKVFGESARNLNPLIEAGSVKLRELAQEAHNVGYVMDQDTLSSFGQLDDAMQRMSKQMDTLKNKLALALLPILTEAAELISKIPPDLILAAGGIVLLTALLTGIAHGVTALSGAYGVLTSTKIADTAATAAQTAATGSAAVAQTGLNLAMNACPIMFLVTGLGLLVGAVSAFVSIQKDAQRETESLSLNVQRQAHKYAELQKATQAKTDSVNLEIERVTRLRQQLAPLIDSQGFIVKNSERAKQIIDEINEIMPDTVKWIHKGRIAYEDEGKAIDLLIAKKKLQIILEQQEGLYRQALLNVGEAETDMVNKRIQLEKEQAKLQELDIKAMGAYNDEAVKQAERVRQLSVEYQQSEKRFQSYSQNITAYEHMMAVGASNNYAAINQVLSNHNSHFKSVSRSTKEEMANQVVYFGTQLKIMKEAVASGSKAYTKDMIDETLRLFKMQCKEYEKVGGDLMSGVATGWESNEDKLMKVVEQTIKRAQEAARKAGNIHSPSRLMADTVGRPLMQGVEKGWADYIPGAMRRMSAELKSGIEDLNAGALNWAALQSKQLGASPKRQILSVSGDNGDVYHITLNVQADKIREVDNLIQMAKAAKQQWRSR